MNLLTERIVHPGLFQSLIFEEEESTKSKKKNDPAARRKKIRTKLKRYKCVPLTVSPHMAHGRTVG
jgi:hypothetical protein